MQATIERAHALFTSQRFAEALPLLQRVITRQPTNWNTWYLAGQCCRFLGDKDGAIKYLSRAAELEPNEPPIFLALGIAYQLAERWKESVATLVSALEIDPDYAIAYNSLGLTQRRCGEFDKALRTYEEGAYALARGIAKGMRNDKGNTILKHREEATTLWRMYAMRAGLYCCALDERIQGMGWPTSEQAYEEERIEEHAGLYWKEVTVTSGEIHRLYLPNFFNTFRDLLKRNESELYSNLVGNRAVVLELLGKQDEADEHYNEAIEFSPKNAQVTDMFVVQEGERMVRAWINGVTKHSGPIDEPRSLGLMAVLDDCEERMADEGDVGRLAKALHAWALAEFKLAYGSDQVSEMQAARRARR